MAVDYELWVDHLDHSGGLLASFRPLGLRWKYGPIGEAGDIFYGIAMSNPDLTRDSFAPYATDWQLRIESAFGTDILHAGIHVPVNMKPKEGVVWVKGVTWLHWLDQPYTTWDYTVPIEDVVAAQDATTLHKQFLDADGDTIQDLIEELLVPLSDNASECVILNPVFSGSAFGQTVDYTLWRTDGQNVIDHLRALARMNDPRGFDFWDEWDKSLLFYGPRRTAPSAVSPIWSFIKADATTNTNIVDIDWTNNGPYATRTIGLGSGQSNTTRYFMSTYQPSVDVYRRWTRFVEVAEQAADVDSQSQVDSLTSARGYLDRFPQKELRLTIKPDAVDPGDVTAGFFNHLAQAVDVDYDVQPYHRIDADFWITSQEFYGDKDGNMLCDLTLDQIYN